MKEFGNKAQKQAAGINDGENNEVTEDEVEQTLNGQGQAEPTIEEVDEELENLFTQSQKTSRQRVFVIPMAHLNRVLADLQEAGVSMNVSGRNRPIINAMLEARDSETIKKRAQQNQEAVEIAETVMKVRIGREAA